MNRKTWKRALTTMAYSAAFIATGGMAWAHCDTMAGPVITEAKTALAKGDVNPVLKWVSPGDEGEIREAFKKTLEVRKQGGKAQELADTWFFETLVRIHRAHEGAPFTGIKATAEEEPAVAAADKALETGSDDALLALVQDKVHEGIHHRFLDTLKKKKEAGKSVEAGREFVEAYVQFIHYGEGIYLAAEKKKVTHGNEEAASHEGH